VLGGVVVLVVVEFDSDGPDSLEVRATTAAPAMIRTAEQIAARIFQFIDELRPGVRGPDKPCTIHDLGRG
jgi:hypothetical protein